MLNNKEFIVGDMTKDFLKNIYSFIVDADNSLRLSASRARIKREFPLKYKTIADSKKEMRQDRINLMRDLRKTVSNYEQESRTK